jgi:hypothetical protein
VRAGAPDASLTASAGLAAVTELCERLGLIGTLDARSARSGSGIAGLALGSCWPGSRRRSWLVKIS